MGSINFYYPRTQDQSRDLNPVPLGEERERYLCAIAMLNKIH